MPALRSWCALAVAALLLSGCSYSDSALDSVFGPQNSAAHPPAGAAAQSSTPIAAAPLPGAPPSAAHAPAPVTGNATGTYVGEKVSELRRDLQQVDDNLARHRADLQQTRQVLRQDSSNYFTTLAGINARLQTGTTPGNPQLVAQWNQAQTTLDHMSNDIARLNSISNQAAADSSRASYLLDSTKAAFALQGAVDEDHRDLSEIQTETSQTIVRIDELLNELSGEIGRQSTYVGNERNNLVVLSLAIKNGQLYGPSLASRIAAPPAIASATPLPAPAVLRAPAVRRAKARKATPAAARAADTGRPLVVIRFDHPNVEYQQAVYTAVSRALARRPDASFDLVAVAPNSGSPGQAAVNANTSKQNAENVLHALTGMGMPANRMTLSSTTSAQVSNNEVRIYVR